MSQFWAVFFALIVGITVLILGGVFSESIAAWLRRRFNWSYEGEKVLVWSMVILSAFSFGLVVMYLLLR
jgi:hypothetical protein